MDFIFFAGRIILGAFFLNNARHHFFQVDAISGYAQSKGVPLPRLAALGSGVLLFVAGVSFILGFLPTVGIIAAVLFLVPVTFMIHAFWKITDPMARMGERVQFSKNVALLGASLMFTAIPQPWPWSL